MRKTRMIYDSLRILAVSEEEKRQVPGLGWRARDDLRAANVKKQGGLWLNRDKRYVGSIPGFQIGDVFFFMMELYVVRLHGHIQAGIDYFSASDNSSGEPIATSIIVSGRYEDDEDYGDVLIYTGQGGQNSHYRQCDNQKLQGEKSLERSKYYDVEIRVTAVLCFGLYKYKWIRIENQPEIGTLAFQNLPYRNGF